MDGDNNDAEPHPTNFPSLKAPSGSGIQPK
jgi:hypothetical protein